MSLYKLLGTFTTFILSGFLMLILSIYSEGFMYQIEIYLYFSLVVIGIIIIFFVLIKYFVLQWKNPYSEFYYTKKKDDTNIRFYEIHTPIPKLWGQKHSRKMVNSAYRIIYAAIKDMDLKQTNVSINIEIVSSLINENKLPKKLLHRVIHIQPSIFEKVFAIGYETLFSLIRLKMRKCSKIKKVLINLDDLDSETIELVHNRAKNIKPIGRKRIIGLFFLCVVLTLLILNIVSQPFLYLLDIKFIKQ